MPAGDRTGPWGLGARTGRGLGYCSGYPVPGFMSPGPGLGFSRNFGFGRGFGRGMGLGRGRGYWRRGLWRMGWPPAAYSYWPPVAPPNREEEKDMLEKQAMFMEEQLEQIKEQLKDLKRAENKKEKPHEK